MTATIPERVEEFKKEFWKLSGDSVTELDRKQDEYVQNMLTETDQQAREPLLTLLKECEPFLSDGTGVGATTLAYIPPAEAMRRAADRMEYEASLKARVRNTLSNPPSQV